MSRRTERVNDLIREELGEILVREVNDPRLASGMVSITEVRVSPDLRYATVYFSTLGSDEDHEAVLASLRQAAPYLHRLLRGRLREMRRVPELRFEFDPSLERGARLSALIREAAEHDAEAD
jgi:ribosome-binding factor A